MPRIRVWASCFALATVACRTVPATQIVVHIDADAEVRERATDLRIRVLVEGSSSASYDERRAMGEFTWPATLPVEPPAERAGARFDVIATATLTDGSTASTSARARFIVGGRGHVWLRIAAACAGRDCGSDPTVSCWNGACVGSCVESTDGPPSTPRECVQATDGGSEAGGTDAGGDGGDAPCHEEGTTCDGGEGTCRAGSCCHGCWDGSACIAESERCPCDDICNGGERCVPPADRRPATVSVWWRHACASSTDGDTWCWGLAAHGQVGVNLPSLPSLSAPVWIGRVGAVVLNGPYHTCGLLTGVRRCWGDGGTPMTSENEGALGFGDLGFSAAPYPPEPTTEGGWRAVQTGSAFGCGLNTFNRLECWGRNTEGQIGLDPRSPPQRTPIEVSPNPSDGGGTRDLASFDVGIAFVLTLSRVGGRVYGWGRNSSGQLGVPAATVASTHVPRRIMLTGDPQVSAVSAGQTHSCAITVTDTATGTNEIWCWGDDGTRSVGETAAYRVQRPAGSTRWTSVSAGDQQTCAIDDRERAFCWGGTGRRGCGAEECSDAPMEVARGDLRDGERWRGISTGSDVSCGRTDLDAIYCWGVSDEGVLGIPPATDPMVQMELRLPHRVCLPAPR